MDNRETMIVAGFDYRQDALRPLLWDENPMWSATKKELLEEYDYDEEDKIFQYEPESYDLHIEAEPTNPYDPNAIKVYADETFIGYVPKGRFDQIRSYAAIPGVKISVEVFGGKYKYLEYDGDADYMATGAPKYYKVQTDSTPVKAVMVFEW